VCVCVRACVCACVCVSPCACVRFRACMELRVSFFLLVIVLVSLVNLQDQRIQYLETSVRSRLDEIPSFIFDEKDGFSLDFDALAAATPFMCNLDGMLNETPLTTTTVPPSVPTAAGAQAAAVLKSRSLRLVSRSFLTSAARALASDTAPASAPASAPELPAAAQLAAAAQAPPATVTIHPPAPLRATRAPSGAIAAPTSTRAATQLKRGRSADYLLDWGTPSNANCSPHPEAGTNKRAHSAPTPSAEDYEAVHLLLLSQVPEGVTPIPSS
jgi:hypothetical protein